ncbi:hypothetical protein [Thiomicrorhabdus sp. Milos-T2]|uniref:hypothetical protein n=1 Tax=Thiomicrorhabdus sp. Milos-T2 TaxID=90814 RepID=UPI00068F50BC|nr:hypothetical protein [Thiomicrorhabdus sp. Milos-T2]
MPGSNHDIDASFMDALPFSVRAAAADLIRYSSLKDMLSFKLEGPSEFLKDRFPLSEDQWSAVLDAVILTKISYFKIEVNFPNRYIDKLIEIACYARGLSANDPMELYQSVLSEHPSFARWIKTAIQTKQANIRIQHSSNT